MDINGQTLEVIFENLNARWQLGAEGYEPGWAMIAMQETSTTGKETYGWYGRFPAMQRWVGEKNLKKLKLYSYSIENEDFEATIIVKRNDIKDEQLGGYGTQAEQTGKSAAELPDTLVLGEAVDNAFTDECYDGQPFIDTEHPLEDSNGNVTLVSNKLTAPLSAASLAAADASLGAAITRLQGFKDAEGKPLKRKATLLMVPPALEFVAIKLCTHEFLVDGVENPYRGKLKYMVNYNMTSTTAWFVMDTSDVVKPFVLQVREAVKFVQMTDPEAERVFIRAEYLYGNEGRMAAGYSFWQLIVGSTGAG